MPALIRKLYRDSLFRNSFFIMAATGAMAGFGFFFWLINAHLFSAHDIGLATTLISVMNLVAIFSLAGFDSTFVRFLPSSKQKNENVNTGLLLVGTFACIISGLFAIGIPHISPSLTFVLADPRIALLFVFGSTMNALNVLTESVFVANRETKYTFVITTLYSFAKMLLPFAFVGFGPVGIFSAAAIAQTLGFMCSIGVMMYRYAYRPVFIITLDIVKNLWRYSGANYAAGVLNLLPITFLPVIITNHISAEASAYYYIAMMIAGVLYIIPMAAARSFFAESSHDEKMFKEHVQKAIRIIAYLLLPAIAVLIFGGNEIMLVFGKNYSGGADFLRILAISGIAVGMTSVFGVFFKVGRHLPSLIAMNSVYAVSVLSLSYALLPFGLMGIGVAWLLGNLSAGILGYILYRRAQYVAEKSITNVIPAV